MRLMRFTRVCRRMRAPCTESRRSVAEFSALNQNLPSPGLDRNPRLDLACSVKLAGSGIFLLFSWAEARKGVGLSRHGLKPCPTQTLDLLSADSNSSLAAESKTPAPASKRGMEVNICTSYWEQAETPDT